MQRVCAILPQVSAYPHIRSSRCSRCNGGILHRHGEVSKRVKDIYVPEVVALRYLCVDYKRIFTRYPQGVDDSGRSVRLRALMSLIMYALRMRVRTWQGVFAR